MVADRISLTYIYDALKIVQENNGKIDSILINKTSHYGSKTIPRFDSLNELKVFINQLYPYTEPISNCKCYTNNEHVFNVLNFSFRKLEDIVFLNNLETGWQTSKPTQINQKTYKKLTELKVKLTQLTDLFENYVCFPYIEFGYIDCDYIEIVRNDKYYKLIELYKNTK